MTDGRRLLELAETRLGQKYRNVLVPKNNPNWQGPWDCAEFTSWLVYQVKGTLYGCLDNSADPALADAYTGAWKRDSAALGQRVPADEAARIAGAFLLRYPPGPGTMGHIAVCDGRGSTVEAMGRIHGVKRGKIAGREWDTGVLIPGFSYDAPADITIRPKPVIVYRMGKQGMKRATIRAIQLALAESGFDPGPIDGIYGPMTTAAVAAYQTVKGIIVDGQVGPQTARRMKITLD